MGVGPIALAVYTKLAQRELIKPGQFVLELGSQEIFADADGLLPFCSAMGKPMAAERKWQSARDLMAALGFHYACIDTDGRFGALTFDLNEELPYSGWGPWDIVTNHGTTEHCFNQAQCFRTMHAETKLGGLMIHCVPNRGYDKHCFYLYQPELFTALASANRYECLGFWTSGDHYPDRSAVELRDYKPDDPDPACGDVLLSVVLRKTCDDPFVSPIQEMYRL